jgi:hypothetical protein
MQYFIGTFIISAKVPAFGLKNDTNVLINEGSYAFIIVPMPSKPIIAGSYGLYPYYPR